MRLLSLDLERYGPFTGRTVAFRPDAHLHVVLGANEAGKTSALNAVTDLLFGIETHTRYAFLHDMPEMRIGAEIQAADGRRLAFRRRKGRKNTLVDSGDKALPEDTLTPFLGGLVRDVFCRAFGLDARSLRAGAAEMMNAEGEVGATLFAAASGLRGYSVVQAALEEEASSIFMPRAAQHRTFYQALGRYEEARRAMRASELRGGDWRDLNGDIDAAGVRLSEIKAERARIAGEQTRLARLRRVSPLLQAIDAVAAQAEAERDLIEVPDPWIDQLGAALTSVETAEAAAARAAEIRESAAWALGDVLPDEAVLVHADAILEAFRGIDRFDKDGLDLPRIQAEVDARDRQLAQLAVRVGLPDGDALSRHQPPDAARTRIEGLIRSGRACEADVKRLAQELATRRAEYARLVSSTDGAGTPHDPASLRADLKAFATLPRELERHDELDRGLKREAALIRAQAARLSPPIPDLSAFIAGRPPSQEAIVRFRRAQDTILRDHERAADRQTAAAQAVAARRLRLREREAGRPIPTRAELEALRGRRDALLATLPGGRAQDFASFEAALEAADRAADDLVDDAVRVAEHAADLQRLEAEQAEDAVARQELEDCKARIVEGEAAWREAWGPSGIVPAPPAEMEAWLADAEALLEMRQKHEDARIEHARVAARIEACRAPLADLGRRSGLTLLDGLDVGRMHGRVEGRVAELEQGWSAAREARARASAANDEIGRIADELEQARAREAAWKDAWGKPLAVIGLGIDASPDEAESALAAWRLVPAVLSERDDRRRRVNGIHRDMDTYRRSVESLVAALIPDLASPPLTATIKALHTRLQGALKSQTRRAELARQLEIAEERQQTACRAAASARAALTAHLAQQGDGALPAGTDPVDLHARLTARRAHRSELAERRAELARAADGLDEATLRADLAASSTDDIEARQTELAMEEEDLDQRGKLAFADRDRLDRRRGDLENSIGAELAVAQRKAAEAELQANARRWAVLKIAGLLLGSAIGRHRAGQQDPLLTRSGALFSALTGNAFMGLAQDYDETDTPRLAARRSSGGLVHVDGLSEGTRDQLYLALRLAYLEDYATRFEPAPFIGDDLFLTFDDARTAHGIDTLAALSPSVQPILFTHHRHVAEIAQARLGERVQILPL